MHEKHSLSIWFFVGFLLTVYGIIILIANIPTLSPQTNNPHVVLEQLHSGVWWGALLLLLGGLFLILHWPGEKPSALDDENPEDA
jgi:hypothetical protein